MASYRRAKASGRIRVRAAAGLCTLLAAFVVALGAASAGTAAAQSIPDAPAPVKYLIVPRASNPDDVTLFKLAESTLGDGNRYPEIFELNKGKPMPDGQPFTDPSSIEEGQILLLPDEAAGADVHFGPLPSPAPRATPPPARKQATPSPATIPAPAAGPSGNRTWITAGLAIAGLLAISCAFLLFLLSLRRNSAKSSREPENPERAEQFRRLLPPTAPAEPAVAATAPVQPVATKEQPPTELLFEPFSGARRGLALLAEPEPNTLDPVDTEPVLESPAVVTHEVTFGEQRLFVQLGGSGRASQGRRGRTAWTSLPHVVPSDGAFVYLGTAERGCLFVDLPSAPGLISLAGDPETALKVADSILLQASGLPDGDRPQILASDAVAGRVRSGKSAQRFDTLDECVAARTTATSFQLVVCTAAELSEPDTVERLRSAAEVPVVMLAIGELPSAAWTITGRAEPSRHALRTGTSAPGH